MAPSHSLQSLSIVCQFRLLSIVFFLLHFTIFWSTAANVDVVNATAAGNGSIEYTILTAADLSILPPSERTVPAALRLCQERLSPAPPGQFCAWLRIDTSNNDAILGGACFDETISPCGRIGSTGGKNSKRYRYLTCDGCPSCASQRPYSCHSGNCSLVCYCSCSRSVSNSSYTPGANWQFAYPCSGLCDGTKHCPDREDEQIGMCDGLYTSGNWSWSFKSFGDVFGKIEFQIFVVVLAVWLLCIAFGALNRRYGWVPWLAHRVPQRRSLAAAALLENQQQQQPPQQQQQQTTNS